MLNVSNTFRNKIFNNPSYLIWEYKIDIANVGTYDSELIKSFNITGSLQNSFTLGSSLSKTLDLELLVSEKTYVPEDTKINVYASLILYERGSVLQAGTVLEKGIEYESNVLTSDYIVEASILLEQDVKETIKLGTFYATDIDRTSLGKLKISAVDAMGHVDFLSSGVEIAFPINISNVKEIVKLIADGLKLGFDPTINPEYYDFTIGNFRAYILEESTYRQLLEGLAGYCGCNVRVNNNEYIEFFKFEDKGIELNKDNYYNMTKGQYQFKPTSIACTANDNNTILLGEGKDSSTIKFNCPFMTEPRLTDIYEEYCFYNDKVSDYVNYYAISSDIIGTGILEPGDVVTIYDHYDEQYKLYIQNYKLSCANGVKETVECFFDYNKGSIANSISGKITKLNSDLEDTKTYITENCITNTEFKTTVEDLSVNIEYANDGLDKWAIEYYEVGEEVTEYDLDSVLGKKYKRREVIEDASELITGEIYTNTICRFSTGVYIKPKGGYLYQDAYFKTSKGANIYLNGGKVVNKAEDGEVYPIRFNSGWNIIEIYTGGKSETSSVISTFFRLKYEETESEYPYYHLTSTITESEREENTYRTIVLNYFDFNTGNLIKNEKLKYKKGSSYDVTDTVKKSFVDTHYYYYFYTKQEDLLVGIVDNTIIIDSYYTSSSYTQIVEEYKLTDEFTILKDNKYSIRNREGQFNIELADADSISGYTPKYFKVKYRTTDGDITEDQTQYVGSGGLTIGDVSNIGKIVVSYYYEIGGEEESYSFTANFIDYETKETKLTKKFSISSSLLYYEMNFTLPQPGSSESLISDFNAVYVQEESNENIEYFTEPTTVVTIYPTRDNQVFNIYGIANDKAYVYIENINEEKGFNDVSIEVVDKNKDYYFTYIGFGLENHSEDGLWDYKLFKPNSACSSPYDLVEAKLLKSDDYGSSYTLSNNVITINLNCNVKVTINYKERVTTTKELTPSISILENIAIPTADEELTYRRFDYISLVNAYVIDINYKKVTEVERLITPESIIDRITEATYETTDEDGNKVNINGADYLFKQSEVKQTVDSITQKIEVQQKTLEETTEKMSEVNQTVDGFKLSFETALYGNYLSNSSFNTDEPLSGFNYRNNIHSDEERPEDIFTYRTDTALTENNIKSVTVSKQDTLNYGYVNTLIPYYLYPNGQFKGVVKNDNKDAYSSSNRTLSMGTYFKLSQTFYSDEENFPFYKDNDKNEYYQLYLSMKAKRTANCIVKNKNYHLYPHLKLSITFNYDYEETIDEVTQVYTKNLTIDNIKGQPSPGEGNEAYGKDVDLDNLTSLDEYEIDTEWKQIDFFVDLPKETFDNMLKLNSITVTFGVKYRPSVSKSYILVDILGSKSIHDIDTVDKTYTSADSIFICEPMFGTTKNYSALPYTDKKAELITGVTNITQDGIEISRSDSKLTTEIKNNGMGILYDGNIVAQFKEKTLIPKLEVTDDLIAPSIYLNWDSKKIPGEIDVSSDYMFDSDVGEHYYDKYICKTYATFQALSLAMERHGFLRKDKITVHIRKGSHDEELFGGEGMIHCGPGGAPDDAFFIKDLKCGLLEIVLDYDIALQQPIVIKNIDGIVKIRGPIDKRDIKPDETYFNGTYDENLDKYVNKAPIVPSIIAHNVKQLEIYGLNFNGGYNFIPYEYDKHGTGTYDLKTRRTYYPDTDATYFHKERVYRWGYYMYYNADGDIVWKTNYDYKSYFRNKTYQTLGEYYTDRYNYYAFNFTDLYAAGTLKELNDILNKVAIFIGYCNLVDISRCNFPKVYKTTDYLTKNAYYEIGIYGDHSDCYLFNNQGETGQYYLNREKCWFRLPLVDDDNKDQIVKPDESGGSINKGTNDIESGATNNITGGGETVDSGVNTVIPSLSDSIGTSTTDLMDSIYPGGMIKKGQTTGTALDNCFAGQSSNLVYLGSLLYDSAPTNTYNNSISVPGSNLSGYSRVKQNISLKGLNSLYNDTNGYFFGSGSSIASVSYAPKDNEVLYNTSSCKYTSLYNGLGFSIAMPDIKAALGENELTSVKLRLEFETSNTRLVEYGNQSAFDTNSLISTYGGDINNGTNQSIAFGVRFVYDRDAHTDSDGKLKLGYYNMGNCRRGHEILEVGKAINSWAINGDESIHSIKNFSYDTENATVSFPFIIGRHPFQDEQTVRTSIEIDLGVVDRSWFDEDYINSYSENLMNANGDYVDADSFFNTLKGMATSAIKFIDIAPVGIWDSTTNSFPSMSNPHGFNYNISGEQDSYIGLSTSCFKLTGAKLLTTIKRKINIVPVTFTIRISCIEENGTVLDSYTITKYKDEEYSVSPMQITGYNYLSASGDPLSGTMNGNKTIVFTYRPLQLVSVVENIQPSDYVVTLAENKDGSSSLQHNYSGSDFKDYMFVGPLYEYNPNNTTIYHKDVGPVSYYDLQASGSKYTGCEFLINNSISSVIDNAYIIDSAYIHIDFSMTSYGAYEYGFDKEDHTNEDLKFYVKLLFSESGSLLGEDYYSITTDELLHYTNYGIELGESGKMSGYNYWFDNNGGSFRSNLVNPYTISGASLTNTSTKSIDIRIDNLTFEAAYIKDIEYNYDYYKDRLEGPRIKPEIFTDVKEMIRQGKFVGVQLYTPFSSDNLQCLKVADFYIKIVTKEYE